MTGANQPDRLDRLENLAANILVALDQLRLRQEVTQDQIAATQAQIDANARAIAASDARIDNLASEVLHVFEEVITRIDASQAEVREMHVENCRILDELQRRREK